MHTPQQVLVVGLGKSGQAVVRFFLHKKQTVTGIDSNPSLFDTLSIQELIAKGADLYHDDSFHDVTRFDLVIISPGVPKSHPVIQQALQNHIQVIGEIELACSFLTNRTIVAVTGTNGKTTVTLLVAHILNSCGKAAKALGNVGIPLISEVMIDEGKHDEILVLELSSYQLETMKAAIIDAAVILNITPDHLDRYPNMDAYATAKLQIASCLKPHGICYVTENILTEFAHLIPPEYSLKTMGYSPTNNLYCDVKQVFMDQTLMFDLPPSHSGKKSHEIENLLAAYALCHKMGITGKQFVEALATFNKPPHRIEFVRERDGVKFFDDSKGTNIDAVIKAVEALHAESLTAKIYLIAGGVDKGSPYAPWLKAFQKNVVAVYAIGQAARKIKEELDQTLPVEMCASLEEAVKRATVNAGQGDYVLLSPGCASFDMFKDYAHRGEEFKRIVNQL